MANSYIDYRGNSVRINDQILTVIVSALADIVHRHPEFDGAVAELVDRWHFEVLHSGPGLIALDFSGYWETEEGTRTLESLLQECDSLIASFGSKIPAESLDALVGPSNLRFVDINTEVIREEIKKISASTLAESNAENATGGRASH